MKKRKIAGLLLAAAMTVSLTACAGGAETGESSDSAEDPIVIGTISPNTGSLAAYGTGITTGVELAAEEINAAGGILGRQVEIITTDDQGDPTECLNAFNSLVSQGVSLIIGSATSGCTSAITEAANEEEVVLMAPTATADSVTTEDDYIFRVCYADSFQGAIAAAFAKKAGYTNVGVVYCAGDVYSKGLYDSFSAACEGYGVTECSPVISLNLPTDARTGTIGQPLPSVRTAIVSVQEPRQRLAAGETGLLLVRGPNVFGGYLGQGSGGGPASPFLHLDGEDWYCTGDLVRADSDGHMTFAGRRERFVKLGGEMISLPQMEAVLGRHFMAPAGQEGPVLAVDALEEEGQTVLVLFTTLPLEREQANAVLREEGLSALYMLRRVRWLAALPLLGSGKVDYRSLRALAMQEGQGV